MSVKEAADEWPIRKAALPVLKAKARGNKAVTDADIEDLASIVVAKVLARLDAGADIADLVVYAKATARTVFVDHVIPKGVNLQLHGDRLGPDEGIDDWLEVLDGGGGSPSAQVIRQEKAARIRAAFASLGARDQALLILRYGRRWETPRIANELDLSPASIDTMMLRARERLRGRLSDSLLP